jgi:brefeldin A-inhibited guanine nucleotide-exchange protein
MRTSTWKHKSVLLHMLSRLSQDAQALVDLYINYDCDSEALENIYERQGFILESIVSVLTPVRRLINVISKISGAKSDDSVVKALGEAANAGTSKSKDGRETVPPSLSTTALSAASSQGSGSGTSDISLRRQALECLVSVLRSLVAWGTTNEKTENGRITKRLDSIDTQKNGVNNASTERLSLSHDNSRVATPEIVDDPSRFESAKQKKTLLMEGIKKFNFKPKRVLSALLIAMLRLIDVRELNL